MNSELYPNPRITEILNDLRRNILGDLEEDCDEWANILEDRMNEAWDELRDAVPLIDGRSLGRE